MVALGVVERAYWLGRGSLRKHMVALGVVEGVYCMGSTISEMGITLLDTWCLK